MILETLLAVALEAGLGLLVEAGFGDELRDFKERLGGGTARRRRAAFDRAFGQARAAAGEAALGPLLEHRPFQEEVINSLLDPAAGFDAQVAAQVWGERLPEHARAVRRFISTFENTLLDDEEWGPILERYQQVRWRSDVLRALEARRLDPPTRELVHRINAHLSGSGGLALQGGVAAGAGGVAAGSVGQVVLQQIILQSGAAPATGSLRQRYLASLLRRCRALPLAALGGDVEPHRTITLDQVYIELNTDLSVPEPALEKLRLGELEAWSQIVAEHGKAATEDDHSAGRLRGLRDELVPLPALDALRIAPRLALLGDPGAGKSTFARAVIARLIEGDPPPGLAHDLLPVLVTLRDLAPRLAALDLAGIAGDRQPDALAGVVRDQMLADLAGLESALFADGLTAALNNGQAWPVFDGLDEVPTEMRGLTRQAVLAALNRYGLRQALVTCRVRSYVDDAQLPGFEALTLAPFSDEQTGHFIEAWYRAQMAVGQGDAAWVAQRAADLTSAARGADLRELASNPMMLTTMAIVHQTDVGLPKQRVRLYSRAVDILLSRWQKEKVGEKQLEVFLKDERKLRLVMERLAYEAHAAHADRLEDAAADLPRHRAQDVLEEYLDDANQARAFLDYVDQRAGLFLGRGGAPGRPAEYSFAHRTFQEYLAGCYLLTGSDSQRVAAFYSRAAETDGWRLAAQMGAEELFWNTRNGEQQLLHLAYNLLGDSLASPQARRAALWSGQMAALAGRDWVERDHSTPTGGDAFLARLRQRLVGLLSSDLSAQERVEAGRVLGELGDPRPEVTDIDAMDFAFVPAGQFVMGSDKTMDPEAYDDEAPQREVGLTDYFMGRILVTNAHFSTFVLEGGYRQAAYWMEAVQAGAWKDGYVLRWKTLLADDSLSKNEESANTPANFGAPFSLPNHPVVGISWHEATAFSAWLTDRWRARGWLPEGWVVRLPSEAEWEKSARGGLSLPSRPWFASPAKGFLSAAHHEDYLNPEPARRYPWQGDFNPNNANTLESKIGTTSSAGCFPDGASPYGVLDLSGNVWEWTRSIWGTDGGVNGEEGEMPSQAHRALRGGSFINSRRLVRCAYRLGLDPVDWDDLIGFRVVVSPFRP